MKSEIIRIMVPAEHFNYFQVRKCKILTTWFFIVQRAQIWCIPPWRWRQQASLKHRHLCIWLHSIVSQKNVVFKNQRITKTHHIWKSCRF